MPVNPYDVYIDGKGYIVKEGTYAAGKQQLAADQFRTGDISYENLSEQQAWPQSDWRGGVVQKNIPSNVNFSSSNEVDVLSQDGALQLAIKFSSIADGTPFDASSTDFRIISKGLFNSFLFTVENSLLKYRAIADLNWSAGANLSSAGNIAFENFAGKLYVTNTSAKTLWASTNPTASTSWSAELSALSFNPARLIGFQDALYISDNAASTPGYALRKYDGSGAATGLSTVINSNEWIIINMCLFNGRIYMGCMKRDNSTVYALRTYDGSTDWTVHIFDGVDSANTTTSPNGSFVMMKVYNGKLYFNMWDYQYQNEVFTFDGNTIESSLILSNKKFTLASESPVITDAVVINGSLYITTTKNNLTSSNNDVWCSPGGNYWFVMHRDYFTSSSYGFSLMLTPRLNNSKFALELMSSNGKRYIEISRSGTPYFATSGRIDSNIIDMDLFSINKRISAMEVYHSSLSLGTSIKADLFVNGNSSSDSRTASVTNSVVGSNKTVLVPTNAVGRNFQYALTLSATTTSSASPLVNDVVLRWVLEPEDKTQVTFDVMAVDNLQLNDGSYETRTGAQIAADLKAARKKAIVSFTDLDGTVYDPTTTNTDNRGMIIKDAMYKSQFDQANSAEFVVSVNMVQA